MTRVEAMEKALMYALRAEARMAGYKTLDGAHISGGDDYEKSATCSQLSLAFSAIADGLFWGKKEGPDD